MHHPVRQGLTRPALRRYRTGRVRHLGWTQSPAIRRRLRQLEGGHLRALLSAAAKLPHRRSGRLRHARRYELRTLGDYRSFL